MSTLKTHHKEPLTNTTISTHGQGLRPMKCVAVLASSLIIAISLASGQNLSKEAKIERLLVLMNPVGMMDQVLDQSKAMMTSQMRPSATPAQRSQAQERQARILDLLKARMSWDKLRPQYVKVYSETFSDQEIDGMLAFYQSPAGRAMVQKMPMLLPKIMALAQAQIGDLTPAIQRIMRETQQK
jgi:uncharacterized protein